MFGGSAKFCPVAALSIVCRRLMPSQNTTTSSQNIVAQPDAGPIREPLHLNMTRGRFHDSGNGDFHGSLGHLFQLRPVVCLPRWLCYPTDINPGLHR